MNNIIIFLGEKLNDINQRNSADINKAVNITTNIEETLKENKRIPDKKLMIMIANMIKGLKML